MLTASAPGPRGGRRRMSGSGQLIVGVSPSPALSQDRDQLVENGIESDGRRQVVHAKHGNAEDGGPAAVECKVLFG